jgi:hypothetical protein
LLGIEPDGFDSFRLRPRLPSAWRKEGYALQNLRLQGRQLDLTVRAAGPKDLSVAVVNRVSGRTVYEGMLRPDETVRVQLP